MNLLHLKYAIEVAKTSSITKAAENLFRGQPNLSRAIRELEENLGFDIFRRTSKGIVPTARGEEFLERARGILSQVDAVERMYMDSKTGQQNFSVSVPRVSYISHAFTEFAKGLGSGECSEIYYKETNSMRTINNIVNAEYKLGILRYQTIYDKNFKNMMEEKGLVSELICEFSPVITVSAQSGLAELQTVGPAELEDKTEIVYGDKYVPSVSAAEMKKDSGLFKVKKRIFIFDRESQFELLSQLPGAFMLGSPIPEDILQKFGLVQKSCPENKQRFRDVLIFKKEYRLTPIENRFIAALTQSKRLFIK